MSTHAHRNEKGDQFGGPEIKLDFLPHQIMLMGCCAEALRDRRDRSSLLFETHYPIFLYDRLREPGGVSKLDTSVESRVESGSSQLMLQKNTGRIGRISECMTLWKQNNIEAKSCCGIWNLGKLLRRVRRRSSCWNFKSTRLLKVQAHPKWVEIN